MKPLLKEKELQEKKNKVKKHIKKREKDNEKGSTTVKDVMRAYSSTAVRRIILILILSVFFSELIIGAMLSVLKIQSLWIAEIVDSIVLVIVLFPIIYIYVRRPLVNNIDEHKKEAEALQKAVSLMEATIESVQCNPFGVEEREKYIFAINIKRCNGSA